MTETQTHNPLHVALVQLTSTEDVASNTDQILKRVEQIHEPVDLITIPENALFLRVSEGAHFPDWDLGSSVFVPFQNLAKERRSVVHLGSVPLHHLGERYNATIWITPDGSISTPYQKMHLFDVDVQGAPPVRESDAFRHGLNPAVMNVKGWNVGLSICYDLRFSDLYRYYHEQQVDAILIPSAFLVPTGQAHWEVLVRARAIETQSYVLAAAQTGFHGGRRSTFGHSLAVDPWGTVLWDGGETPTAKRITLTRDVLEKVRRQIPLLGHRRKI